jgi:hypothetical protein
LLFEKRSYCNAIVPALKLERHGSQPFGYIHGNILIPPVQLNCVAMSGLAIAEHGGDHGAELLREPQDHGPHCLKLVGLTIPAVDRDTFDVQAE